MATITVPGMFLTGDHASRPAFGDVGIGTLYSCTDHDLIYQSDGSAWNTWATVGGGGGITVEDEGTPLSTTADTLDFVGAGVTASGTGTTKTITIPGGGGAEDPIAEVFGSPDTAFEFDTSSFTGLTAIGSVTSEDADTTIPGHYYVTKAATSSVAMCGRYASVSSPFTAISKVSDFTAVGADFNRCTGLFMAAASPGVIESIHLVTASSDWTLAHERYTNSTTYDTTIGSNIAVKGIQFPLYYMIVCNSTTDVDWWYSFGGRVWRKRTDARNPGFTPGSVGLIVDPSNATFAVAAAFDFLRIWNSALTIPGV